MSRLRPPEIWGITADRCAPDSVCAQVQEALAQGVDRVVLRERRLAWSRQLDLMQRLLAAGIPPERLLLRVEHGEQLFDATTLGCGVHLADRPWSVRPDLPFVSRAIHRLEALTGVEADALVVSAIRAPRSKLSQGPVLGLTGLRRAVEATSKPIIAMGGVDPKLAQACIQAGAAGVAAITAVFGADTSERAALIAAAHAPSERGPTWADVG